MTASALFSPLPSLFVSHGAPTFALEGQSAAAVALREWAGRLPRPRAIIMVSAHHETLQPELGTNLAPETVYDFFGFPQPLYRLRYPAKGEAAAANLVLNALQQAGYAPQANSQLGLDHGAWVPLRHMYPEADIPVLPLSVQPYESPAYHWRLGLALAPLAAQGFLVIGSGSMTHNLRDYQLAARTGKTPAYVENFAAWMQQHLQAADLPALFDYRQQAPEAARAHPSEEHFLPLYVALGAAGVGAKAERFFHEIQHHVIAMDHVAFYPQ